MAIAEKPAVYAMREHRWSGSASTDLGSSSSYSNGITLYGCRQKAPVQGG